MAILLVMSPNTRGKEDATSGDEHPETHFSYGNNMMKKVY